MAAGESWQIDTPENVVFDYEVAGIGSRFLAALVDTVIITVAQIVVYVTVFLLARVLLGSLDAGGNSLVAWLLALFGLVAFAGYWGYYVVFEMLWNGQSPGKRWAGLRVIRADGTPITLSESAVRNLVRMVDMLPALYGVGVIAMFIDAQARRLGDMAAGTMVVHDKPTVTLESLSAQPAAGPFPAPAPAVPEAVLPIARLSSEDIQIAEDFLRRRGAFADDLVLSQQIALMLLRKMGQPESRLAGVYPVNLIRAIVQAWRGAAGER